MKDILSVVDDCFGRIEKIREYKFMNKLVLSHNDLIIGNILYTTGNRYQFIDFEYTGFNYFLSDIYNLLMESTYIYDDDI